MGIQSDGERDEARPDQERDGESRQEPPPPDAHIPPHRQGEQNARRERRRGASDDEEREDRRMGGRAVQPCMQGEAVEKRSSRRNPERNRGHGRERPARPNRRGTPTGLRQPALRAAIVARLSLH